MAVADPLSQAMLGLMECVLSSSSERRSLENVEKILPLLRTRSPLFYSLSKDTLVDIATNATFKKVKRDHAVIWEGQEGNHFGIILKGAASVHARKDQARVPQQDSVPIPRGHKDRVSVVGPELSNLSAGSSFGEMAMSCEHPPYNVTIIADELIYVLLIDRALYARSFGAHRLEWGKKVAFVNQSPLFQNLTPAIKNLLMENLKPVEIQFGNRFIKQGGVCNSIFFVRSGWGKVIADLRMSMTQYEAMKATSVTKGKSSGRKTVSCAREQIQTTTLDPSRPLSVIDKRRHRQEFGYVAIETLLRRRESPVTTTGPNDVIGDIEIIMNLPTYCASVECMETLHVYELSKLSFYQIINQGCTQTHDLLHKGVLSKLHFRAQRLKDVPLYSFLYEKATNPAKDPKTRRKSSIPKNPVWKKKSAEVQSMNKVIRVMKKNERPTGMDKRIATVSYDRKEAGPSNTRGNNSEDQQPDKKAGPKQYTAEEFRVLKKKMQSLKGKVGLRKLG